MATRSITKEDFEGSLLLEQLAALGLVDEFFEAIDSDDINAVETLLREADIDDESIQTVVKMILNA